MIVQVTPTVRVRAEDGHNYTIEQRTVTQTGKRKGQEYWEAIGYYGSLRGAVHALLNQHVAMLIDERSGVPSKKLQLKLNHVTKALEDLTQAILEKLDEKVETA